MNPIGSLGARVRNGVAVGVWLLAALLVGPMAGMDGFLLSAQQGATPQPAQASPDVDPSESVFGQDVSEPVITPGGAFLRSMLVPGWGHVATEAYARGGFYVAAQAGSLWMLLQTLGRRAESEAFRDLERNLVTARLQAEGLSDPTELIQEVDRDPSVLSREALVEARDGQVEDWAALSIFLVLLGATDAFVAAHLADYPEPLTLQVLPLGLGRAEFRFSIPTTRVFGGR